MAQITIQMLEGFERGRVLADLSTPVTIGREEDNTIQLNDERVSRFHVKIQETAARHPDRPRQHQWHPDQRAPGAGSRAPARRPVVDRTLAAPVRQPARDRRRTARRRPAGGGSRRAGRAESANSDRRFGRSGSAGPRSNPDAQAGPLPAGPPELPVDLRMAQMAQLSDVLAFVHDQLAIIVEQGIEDRKNSKPRDAGRLAGLAAASAAGNAHGQLPAAYRRPAPVVAPHRVSIVVQLAEPGGCPRIQCTRSNSSSQSWMTAASSDFSSGTRPGGAGRPELLGGDPAILRQRAVAVPGDLTLSSLRNSTTGTRAAAIGERLSQSGLASRSKKRS